MLILFLLSLLLLCCHVSETVTPYHSVTIRDVEPVNGVSPRLTHIFGMCS
jgi:hypothetical protein